MYVSQTGPSSSIIGENIFICNSLLIFTIPVLQSHVFQFAVIYEGWNFNSGNYLFTTDTK